MSAASYKIYVVVDRFFGERLALLETPVWIVDTPTNKPVAQRLWRQFDVVDHLTGITTFDDIKSSSPEELLLAELDTIDLHHGSYSATPPYTVIEVIGASLTVNIRNALGAYGFNQFQESSAGFTAKRPEPQSNGMQESK